MFPKLPTSVPGAYLREKVEKAPTPFKMSRIFFYISITLGPKLKIQRGYETFVLRIYLCSILPNDNYRVNFIFLYNVSLLRKIFLYTPLNVFNHNLYVPVT